MSAQDAIERKLDAEFAAFDVRFWNGELDALFADMHRDANFLEENGEYAGATLMQGKARQLSEVLAKVRQAQATLDHSSHNVNKG